MAVIAYQYRGDLVDQIHRGHIAVTDHTGKILWKLGDPERLTFARSSAKPLQAIPVAESGALEHYGITPQELAVICSSHNGEPFHVKAVESILHKAGLSPDQLCCGSEYPMYVPAEDALKIAGIPRAPIYCDCSGKHAGMLITARHLGESLEGYGCGVAAGKAPGPALYHSGLDLRISQTKTAPTLKKRRGCSYMYAPGKSNGMKSSGQVE